MANCVACGNTVSEAVVTLSDDEVDKLVEPVCDSPPEYNHACHESCAKTLRQLARAHPDRMIFNGPNGLVADKVFSSHAQMRIREALFFRAINVDDAEPERLVRSLRRYNHCVDETDLVELSVRVEQTIKEWKSKATQELHEQLRRLSAPPSSAGRLERLVADDELEDE